MSYVIPAIEGEPSITWNGKVYWPVTQWTVSQGIDNTGDTWLAAASRFLMEEGATETSFHLVVQYTAYSRTGKIDTSNGYMLLRKIGSSIVNGNNELGTNNPGDFVSTKNQNQRQGYVYNATLTGSKIWYDRPYFMTEAWTTPNGNIAAGTVSDGVTVYGSVFYVGTTEYKTQGGQYLPIQTHVDSLSYTTPLETYQISYNANGGSGTTASQTKTRGTDIALSANSFTRSNYHFVEWNTAADGSGVSYAEGATYNTDAALTLYAIWAINYVLPVFSNVQLYRVDSSGTMDDYADYVEVSFDYNFAGNKFSSGVVTVQYRQKGQSAWTNLTTWNESVTISTRTGTWDALSYASASSKTAFSTDVSWEFQIFLTETTTDSETYQSSIYNTVLTVALFPLDIYDGVSVAIGEPAPESLPTDGGGNTVVDGVLTLGKAWDLDLSLDLTNTIDGDLNTAITNAGVSSDVFHDTGDLSMKLLLTSMLVNSGVELISGGTHNGSSEQPSYSFNAWKFSSGLLLTVFSKKIVNISDTSGWGTFDNNQRFKTISNVQFPSEVDSNVPEFIEAPYTTVQVRAGWNLLAFQITGLNTKLFNGWLWSMTPGKTAATAISVDVVAIGRWK